MSAALRHARELHRFGLRELLWARAFASFPRIGSAVVVTDGERLLLAQRKKTPSRGKWVFPGGKIEPFESIREAAAREIREETGLEVEVGDQIGAFEIINPPDEHRLIIFSWAKPTGGTLRAASDVGDLKFCTRSELAELDLGDIVRRVAVSVGWLEHAPAAEIPLRTNRPARVPTESHIGFRL